MLNILRNEWAVKTILIASLYALILGKIPPKRDDFNALTRAYLYGQKPTIVVENTQNKVINISYEIESEQLDPRAAALMDFLQQRNSPLADEAVTFIEVSDKYGIDWRLLPAIACKESGCGTAIPRNYYENKPSYNPFGWGVYGQSVIYFESWEQAIDTVGKNIKDQYYDKGLTTPEQIEPIYTPPSLAKGRPWSRGVNYLMSEMAFTNNL